jgi:hypothetical protein
VDFLGEGVVHGVTNTVKSRVLWSKIPNSTRICQGKRWNGCHNVRKSGMYTLKNRPMRGLSKGMIDASIIMRAQSLMGPKLSQKRVASNSQ